jgi:protein SCO1/2
MKPSFRTRARSCLVAAALVPLLFGAAACSNDKPAFQNLDVTGNASFGKDFALPDTTGAVRTLADYTGKVVVLFFGYTHCPDVCPTTLAELAQAMTRLGDDARRVQVLFVTVDPDRDLPATLAEYTRAFNPAFVGLRPANAGQLDRVARDFRVYYAKVPDAPASGARTGDGGYSVDHTAASYVFGPDGRLRLYARDGQGPDPWVHDIKLLLD